MLGSQLAPSPLYEKTFLSLSNIVHISFLCKRFENVSEPAATTGREMGRKSEQHEAGAGCGAEREEGGAVSLAMSKLDSGEAR